MDMSGRRVKNVSNGVNTSLAVTWTHHEWGAAAHWHASSPGWSRCVRLASDTSGTHVGGAGMHPGVADGSWRS